MREYPAPPPIRARIEPGLPFSGSNRSPIGAPFKTKPKLALFWQTDEIKSSTYCGFTGRSQVKWAFVRSRKKRLPDGPLLPVYGHHIGHNLGVFWQNNRVDCVFFMRAEKGHFTGVFLEVFQLFWSAYPDLFFARNSFVSRKFSTFRIIHSKFPARSPFRAGFFWPGELSFQKFFRFSIFMAKIFQPGKFHDKKQYGLSAPTVRALEESLRWGSECVAEFKPFFPTFVPVFFRFFEFRPENFPVFQISNRKKSGQKNFAAKKIRP